MRVCVQLEEMRQLSSRNVDVSDRAQAELKNARKRIEELNTEMNRLISQVTDILCKSIYKSSRVISRCLKSKPLFYISVTVEHAVTGKSASLRSIYSR